MQRDNLAEKIFKVSYLTGTFTLRSGIISNEYFDKYLFESDPAILNEISEQMKGLVPEGTDFLAGLELGGIPVATMLSAKMNIPTLFVRKKAKEYGTCKLAEGADFKGKRVCVIEDVVTTGGQIIESAGELRERGAVIDTVLCVIMRDEAGMENLAKHDLQLKYLFSMKDLKK